MKQCCLVAITLLSHLAAFSQGANYKYDRIFIGDEIRPFSWLDLSPDHSKIAVATVQKQPYYIYNIANRSLIHIFNIGKWNAGAKIDYSQGGKYLLTQQLFNMDVSTHKGREADFEIIDSETGKIVQIYEKCKSVVISSDEQYAITLSGEEVTFRKLPDGNHAKSFTVPYASNSIALSPDGRTIAVAHKGTAAELKSLFPNLKDKKQKKTLKNIQNYKNLISFYDVETLEKKSTVKELYDIVFRITYSNDGEELFVYNIPHHKMATSTGGKQSFVNVVHSNTGEASKMIFPTFASYEPDFKLSPDKKYFGITTTAKFPELHIYNFNTGKILKRFELSFRLFEDVGKGATAGVGRVAFSFFPDNKRALITFGNSLILWDMEIDE